MTRVLLISVKPEFAEKIFSGKKRIELRKSSPKVSTGDIVIIYSTQPEKAVLGSCTIKQVIKQSPFQLWRQHSDDLGIDKKRYFEYYKDCNLAIGLVLSSVNRYGNKITLESIKKNFPDFYPPQTFKYLSSSQIKWVQSKIV